MTPQLAHGLHLSNPVRPHDPGVRRPVPVRLIAEWEPGTFVENLLSKDDGHLFVTIHSTGELFDVDPADGSKTLVHRFPTSCAGIVQSGDTFFINTGNIGEPNAAVYRMDSGGSVARWVDVPGALFLNGCALISAYRLLSVDSIAGKVFSIDLETRTATVWLDHALLGKVSQEAYLPAANGMKIFRDHVYISNTDSAKILRARIEPGGGPGPLEVFAERLNSDDFVFDSAGAIYFCTHLANSVLRMRPDGAREDLAGPEEGLAGSTAAAFGRHPDQRGTLFVTTTGGILEPYGGVVKSGKLLALNVGAEGL